MMRWIVAMLLAWPVITAAATVYKCAGRDGAVIFSQTPCGSDAQEIELQDSGPPAPPSAPQGATPKPQTDQALEPAPVGSDNTPPPQPATQTHAGPVAYRCFTPDGMTFYRHAHCPKFVAVTIHGRAGRFQTSSHGYAPVEEQTVGLRTACNAIYASDAEHRFGSGYDQRYSIYERNAGRDPCRK